jgi:hypothetical protein
MHATSEVGHDSTEFLVGGGLRTNDFASDSLGGIEQGERGLIAGTFDG